MKKLVFLVGFWAVSALAHPVAFEGAIAVTGFNQRDMLNWQANYSATSRLALGLDYVRDTMNGPERHYGLTRVNYLLSRWNGEDSQANVYLSAGAGAATQGTQTSAAFFGAVESDYETRKLYVSGKASGLFAKNMEALWMTQARIGVAPYVADFKSLHTWLIFQAQYFPNSNMDSVRVGPVLRFFIENILWEVGVTNRGSWIFNFMVHF